MTQRKVNILPSVLPPESLPLISFPYPETCSYSLAFQNAALKLVEGMDKGNVMSIPVVFLFRQAIELRIKSLLMDFGDRIGIQAKDILNRSHRLGEQLEDLSNLAADVEEAISQSFRDSIALWDSDDPMGMRSRFATDKTGNADVLRNIQSFDVVAFAQRQQKVLDELDRLGTTLCTYDDWKAEQESAMNDPGNW